ncbi:MAG: MORN repeat-containing protein [Bacteroidota bacterium]
MKKVKNISFYIAPVIIVGCLIAIFFISKRKNHFKEETRAKATQLDSLEHQSELYRQKSKADELFIAGEYDDAMDIYLEIEDSIDDKSFMKSRKETIARFNSLRSELDSTQSMSSSQMANMEREMDKKIKKVENEYEQKIENLKKRFDQDISSMKNTIAQKEKEIQNKAELGRLTFYNANGTKIAYFGEVKFGKANGEGVGHYSSNSVYDGDWKNNMKHGKGTYKWADGHKYVGEYRNDKREGQGTYYWNTGEKYEGQWKNDKRNGQGTLYDKDGNVKLEGEWKDDELVQ